MECYAKMGGEGGGVGGGEGGGGGGSLKLRLADSVACVLVLFPTFLSPFFHPLFLSTSPIIPAVEGLGKK